MIHKIGDILEKAIKCVIIVMMAVMIITTIVAVFQRYVVGHSFNFTEELDSYILIWCTFLGVAVSYRHLDLVFLDLFVNLMPQKPRAIVALAVHVVCLAFVAYIFVTSLKYGLSPSLYLRRSTSLGCSMFAPFASIPLSMFLMILFNFEVLPKLVRDCIGGKED